MRFSHVQIFHKDKGENNMQFKKNTIKLDIASYRHYWRGEPKVGKTTLFRDLVVNAYGDAKHGLLISIGQEIGYRSLDNLFVFDTPTWSEIVEVVDDLTSEEGKAENEIKIIALDTVDQLVEIAEKEVLRLHRLQKPENSSSVTINSALGGFGAGKKKARSLIEDMVSRLERAGYGMIYISHTRIKDITEKATDVVFQQLTGALEFSYDAIFSNRADVMAMFTTESEVKEERLKSSTRYIYFRSTNFINAGSRIANLPEKIVLNAENYVSALNTALEKGSGITGKDAVKARKQEEKVRAEEAQEFIDKDKEVVDLRKSLTALVKSFEPEKIKLKKAELEENGLPQKFSDVDDVETLNKISAILSK